MFIHSLVDGHLFVSLNNAAVNIHLDFPGGVNGKNLPASARDIRDLGLVRGWGRFLEEGMQTQATILAWKIPWTVEYGGPQSIESQSSRHN